MVFVNTFSKTEYYVLILGLDNAGKTALLEQIKVIFNHNQPSDPNRLVPTVGLNIGRIEIDNCKMILWDLGGQWSLRSIWDKYYSECHALIYVVDSTDTKRFSEAKSTLNLLLDNQELKEVPVLLLANKQDLPEAKKETEINEIFLFDLSGSSLKANRQFYIQEISAVNGTGITQGLTWLCNTLKTNARTIEK